MRLRHKASLAAVTVGALVLCAAPASLAAGPGGAASPGPAVTFGVRPIGAHATPDGRASFSYQSDPGGRIDDRVEITNFSLKPLLLRLYANDAETTTGGGFDLLPGNRAPRDAGRWITLTLHSVRLAPRAHTVVGFTFAVPLRVTPGDHAAGIVASLSHPVTRKVGGRRVLVEDRVGVRVYVRVNGALQPRLAITGLRATGLSVGPLGARRVQVQYVVRNPGNVRLGARQTVLLSGRFGGHAVLHPTSLGQLLPDATVPVTAVFTGLHIVGPATVKVVVWPFALGDQPDPKLQPATATTHLWVLSAWWLLLLLLPLAAAARRWRRRRPPAAPADTKARVPVGAGR